MQIFDGAGAPTEEQHPDTEPQDPPAQQPIAPAEPEPAAEPPVAAEPELPKARLQRPEVTNGVYVVLWARKPRRGEARPSYQEVTYLEARSPQHAKEQAFEGPTLGAFLKHSAAQKPGILVRAVPAMHWPDTIEPTTYDRPDPVLTIR